MPPELVLSIDLGSSWCKAAYLDRHGTVVAEGRAFSRAITDVLPGRLDRFWQVLVDAVRAAGNALGQMPVPNAIGFSCRGLFGICLDGNGQGFIPSYDILSAKSSPDVAAAFRAPVWGADGPYAYGYTVRLAGMLAGLRRTAPEEWRRIHRVGALHDYIVYRLCGQWTTDPSTGPNHYEWPDGLMRLSGLPPSVFPTIRDPWEAAGRLPTFAAEALELPPDTMVVVGMHDGAAANAGTGTVHPSDACLTLGTNFALRAVTGARPDTDCFGYLVAPGQWAWVNSVPRVATQLDLVATALMDAPVDLALQHARLGELAASVSSDVALPSLPLHDVTSLSEAVWDARHHGYCDGAIYLAMLRAAATGVRGLVEKAAGDGAPAARFVATGGGARNVDLLRFLAMELRLPIEIGHPEAGMLGAGMTAAIGAGWYGSLPDAWRAMAPATMIVHPDPDMTAANAGKVYL